MTTSALFNEDTLREEVIEKFGPAGAHIEILDDLIKKARVSHEYRECLKIAHGHALRGGYREMDKTDRERVQNALW